MSIGMIDAIAGGGKTTAIVQQAIELATTLKQRICIALPTKEVIDEKYQDACVLADGRVAVHRVHGDVPGCDHVGQRLEQLLSEIGTRKPAVLFVTHNISEAVYLADRVVVMSAHPGRIARTLKVTLPRPRTADMRETMEFLALVREAREALKGESTKAAA